jgi:hypothetical protein
VKHIRIIIWPASVLIAFLLGVALGSRVISAVYGPEIKAAVAERDKAKAEAKFWQDTLRRIVEGEQPRDILIGKPSKED